MPDTAQSPVIDHYPDGSTQTDPYRWLEDYQSPSVTRWAAAQDAFARRSVRRESNWQDIRKRAARLSNFVEASTRVSAGGRLFFTRKLKPGSRRSLLVESPGGTTPRVLYGPESAAAANLVGDIVAFFVSPQGRYVALTVSERAGDWQRIIVLDAVTGRQVGEPVRWVKSFGQQVVQWRPDGSGFYYRALPSPEETVGTGRDAPVAAAELRFRRIDGTAGDRLIFRAASPGQLFTFTVAADENSVAINVAGGLLAAPILLIDDRRDEASVIARTEPRKGFLVGVRQREIYLLEQGKSNGRLIALAAGQASSRERTVIAESEAVIRSVEWWGSRIVVSAMHNVCNDLRVYSLDGRLERNVAMPSCGMVVPSPLAGGSLTAVQDNAAFGGAGDTYYFAFRTFFDPGSIFRLDTATLEPRLVESSHFKADPAQYSQSRIMFTGDDGVSIPAFVIAPKGTRPGQLHRVLLTAYGALGNSILPGWMPPLDIALWLELGGVYVQAHVRGGGEFGDAWHQAARQRNRQTSFDDFYTVARGLISQGYTKPSLLGITGTSNGGLMTATAVTQRPTLFGAAVIRQPVTDMMRYDLFTMGRLLIPEYGSATNAADVGWIRAYSPYQNVSPQAYPATLVITGDRDDRAVPLHAFKFAARMQADQTGRAPILLMVYPGVGHGLNKTPEMLADEYSFLLRHLR